MNSISTSVGPIDMLVLQGTPFCNINCSYCYLPDRSDKSILDLTLISDIVDDLLLHESLIAPKLTVLWHAGEPLVLNSSYYNEAISIISRLSNITHIQHSMQTNATLLNSDHCDLISDNNIQVGVSVDGPEFIHNMNRKGRNGLGTFNATMKGIELLHKYSIPFNTISVLTEHSTHHPKSMFEFFSDIKTNYVCFNIDEVEGDNALSSFSDDSEFVQFEFFLSYFYRRLKNEANFKVRELDQMYSYIFSDSQVFSTLQNPMSILSVNQKGDLSTFSPELVSYEKFSFSNIYSGGISEIQHSSNYKEAAASIKLGVESCARECSYFDVCGGGAPSNKYFENGSFNSTETTFCKMMKKRLCNVMLNEIERDLDIT